jgi:hypothetical protein
MTSSVAPLIPSLISIIMVIMIMTVLFDVLVAFSISLAILTSCGLVAEFWRNLLPLSRAVPRTHYVLQLFI